MKDEYKILISYKSVKIINAIKKAVIKMHNAGFMYDNLRYLNIFYRKKNKVDDNSI